MEAASAPEPRDVDERLARMRERADRDFPESWKPREPGEEIAGELARWERGTSSYDNRDVDIAVLRTPEGTERGVWLLHAVLIDEFKRQRPKVGELILLRYEGKKESTTGGASYTGYRLVVDREADGPAWDEASDEPAPTGDPDLQIHEPLDEPTGEATAGADDDIPF